MNIEDIRQQAQNENTAPERLAELARSEDKKIRQYVAVNPNTPVEILEKLSQEFPDEIIENPLFNLLLLENPSSQFVRLSLARSSITSGETLGKLADLNQIIIQDIEIIYAIAEHSNTPIIILEKLLNWRPNFYFYYGSGISYSTITDRITYCIANNQNTPPHLLKQIAVARSKYIHSHIPNNKIYPQTIEKIRKSIDFQILKAIADHQNTSADILEYLAGENCPIIHQSICQHRNASRLAIDIIKFRQGKLRRPLYILEILAKDCRAEVRQLVASHPNTPIKIIELLAKDEKLQVLLAIIQKSNIPTFILEELAKRSNKQIHKAILKHPNISSKAKEIVKLMRSRSPVKISDYILEELAQDERVLVRKRVVKNELTPSFILKKLLNDSNKYIREKATQFLLIRRHLAIKPNISIEIIQLLSQDTNYYVLVGLAKNINVSSEILAKLARSSHSKVRKAVAENTNTSLSTLQELLNDKDGNIIKSARDNLNKRQ